MGALLVLALLRIGALSLQSMESLSSELSLEVSEELPESVPLGLKLYAIGK